MALPLAQTTKKSGGLRRSQERIAWAVGLVVVFFVARRSGTKTSSPVSVVEDKAPSHSSSSGRWRTAGELKQSFTLPCNYIHDGHYLQESNEMLHQAYQSLMKMDDETIPIMVESGGHDGITKSLSLKVSRCLGMATVLIEASPNNYKVLAKTRPYDFPVNFALGAPDSPDTLPFLENSNNSGENKVVQSSQEKTSNTIAVPCRTLDAILDELVSRHVSPAQRSKVQLSLMVLDIEGFEATAIRGMQKYIPKKLFMERKTNNDQDGKDIAAWIQKHGLKEPQTKAHTSNSDVGYNFESTVEARGDAGADGSALLHTILYGARKSAPPPHEWATSKVSKFYWFYGE